MKNKISSIAWLGAISSLTFLYWMKATLAFLIRGLRIIAILAFQWLFVVIPNWILGFLSKLGRRGDFWFTVYTLGVLALTAWWGDSYRDQLTTMEADELSAVIRNVGMVSGGFIALGLAAWRSCVAKRQADIAQASLLNERFQRAVELLGREELHIRIGAIYMFRDLAETNPKEFSSSITSLLLEFAIWGAARTRHKRKATAPAFSLEDVSEKWSVEDFHERLDELVKARSGHSARGLDYQLAVGLVPHMLGEAREKGVIGGEEYFRKMEGVDRLQESWLENLDGCEEERKITTHLTGEAIFQRRPLHKG